MHTAVMVMFTLSVWLIKSHTSFCTSVYVCVQKEKKYLHFGFFGPRHREWDRVSSTVRLWKKARVEFILVLAFKDLKTTSQHRIISHVAYIRHFKFDFTSSENTLLTRWVSHVSNITLHRQDNTNLWKTLSLFDYLKININFYFCLIHTSK